MEKIIELPKIYDIRGNLSFIEGAKHIPFNIERAYWIYDVPGGEERGAHAFREQHEFIVALSGSFDVVLNDGVNITRHHLNRSYKGIYIPPMNWRSLDNFSTNSLCLVLSSRKYNPDDYIEDFDEFLHELTNAEINRIESVIPNFIIDNKIFVSEIFYKSTVNSCKEY